MICMTLLFYPKFLKLLKLGKLKKIYQNCPYLRKALLCAKSAAEVHPVYTIINKAWLAVTTILFVARLSENLILSC